MSYQIDLYKPGPLLIPFGEGANRDLLLEQRARLGSGAAPQFILTPFRLQQAIGTGRTDAQQLRPRLAIATELIVALEHGEQLRQHWLQALAADVVHDAPQSYQSGLYLFVIATRALSSPARLALHHHDCLFVSLYATSFMSQHQARVPATITSGRDKLVQNLAFLFFARAT